MPATGAYGGDDEGYAEEDEEGEGEHEEDDGDGEDVFGVHDD